MPKKFTAIFLWLCSAGVALASDKPAVAPDGSTAAQGAQGAQGDFDEASRRAAAAAVTGIEVLGANPSTRQISNIVFNAVRNSPAAVLLIVHAAVLASPQAAAPGIVTAATAAVPDPWKKVTYHRITSLALKTDGGEKSAPDFKGGSDGKQSADFKRGPGTKSPATTEYPALTLAEAIIRTAFDAQPGLSLPALQSAADIALVGDPAVLLRYIQSPRSISGVGVAGTSNYANEPLRPTVSSTAPVPAPNPPVVSR